MFGDIRISYLFDKYSPASGRLCSLDQKLWIQWRNDTGPYILAQSPAAQ